MKRKSLTHTLIKITQTHQWKLILLHTCCSCVSGLQLLPTAEKVDMSPRQPCCTDMCTERGGEETNRGECRRRTRKTKKYTAMSNSQKACAYLGVFTTIISACFNTFLRPPQSPQPQVNQQHLRQPGNDAFHIQHTTNTTFSPLSPQSTF